MRTPDFVTGIETQRLQSCQQLLLKFFVARFGHDTDTGLGVDGTDDIVCRPWGGEGRGRGEMKRERVGGVNRKRA